MWSTPFGEGGLVWRVSARFLDKLIGVVFGVIGLLIVSLGAKIRLKRGPLDLSGVLDNFLGDGLFGLFDDAPGGLLIEYLDGLTIFGDRS